MNQRGLMSWVKRVFDVVVALSMLLVTSPVLLVTSLAIARNMGRPVLFRQSRPGRHGELFEVMKFRTMRDAYDPDGNPLPDVERLTALGSFLRKSSIDELPQLWNVVRGDMSMVGPRPLLVKYLDRYSATQNRRHEVVPGVTGWSQVNGRNAIGWPEKLAHDVWYVDNWSFLLDIRILFLTVLHVVRRDGISASSHVTMPEFTGTEVNENGTHR